MYRISKVLLAGCILILALQILSPPQPLIPNYSSGEIRNFIESDDYSRNISGQTPNIRVVEFVENESNDQILDNGSSAHLYYYSTETPELKEINDNDTIVSDEVSTEIFLLGAIELEDDPDTSVMNTSLGVGTGVLFERQGSLIVPDGSYDPFSGPIDTTQFAWDYVEGIGEGDNVDIEVDFTNGDCDIMVWWADTDNTTWSYSNNLVADQMVTGGHPEVGSFVADRSGSLAVGIFDYNLTAGQYTVTVDTRIGVYHSAIGNEVESSLFVYEDSIYAWFDLVGMLANGTTIERHISGVRIVTTFNPEIENLRVSGSGAVKTIEWSISDQNSFNPHTYNILLSADEGQTFQLLDTDLTDTSYTWDSTGFMMGMYCFKVSALYSSGLEVSAVSSLFDAGTVHTGGPIVVSNTTTEDVVITSTYQGNTSLLLTGFSIGITIGSVSIIVMVLVQTFRYYRKDSLPQ